MKQPILFLEQQSWRGGAERVLDEVLRALEPDFIPLVAFPEEGPYAAELQSRNIETFSFPLGRYRPGRKSLAEMAQFTARSLYCALRLARLIRRRSVRCVYINGPRCLPAGALAALLSGRPSVFHLHRTLIRKTDLLLATRAARHVTRIIACSEAAAFSLSNGHERLADKTQVLYNPVQGPTFPRPLIEPRSSIASLRDPSQPAVVGLVGRVTPQKGQDVLLRAAARLKRRGQNLRVVILGGPAPDSTTDASYFQTLKKLTRELDLEGIVRWEGFQDDVTPYYRQFDVLVIPATEGEGLPMVALEAMQWGIPVIASRIGGIPEIVRDGLNGLLVPPGDEAALAISLERVLHDPALRARLQVGARNSMDGRSSTENFRRAIREVVLNLCAIRNGPLLEARV